MRRPVSNLQILCGLVCVGMVALGAAQPESADSDVPKDVLIADQRREIIMLRRTIIRLRSER
jgi:hypothetical protein